MKIKSSFAILLISLLSFLASASANSNVAGELESSLLWVDAAIRKRASSVSDLSVDKKYSLKFDGQPEVEFIDSLKMPARKDNSYPLLLRVDRTLYNIVGQEMFRMTASKFMISASRNDYCHIAEKAATGSKQWAIMQLEIMGRQCSLKQIALLQEPEDKVTSFMSLMYKGKRVFLLGTDNGNIVVYGKNGEYERTFEMGSGPIVQMVKSSANLYIRSNEGLAWIGLTHQKPLTKCELPDEQIRTITISNDHGSNRFYALTSSHIFVYEVGQACKPKQVLNIPQDSTLHVFAESVLAFKNMSAVMFNSSLGYKSSWASLRKPTMGNADYELRTFKKSEGVSGMAFITYNKSANQTEMVFYQHQFQDTTSGELFNLRGFKAPIFVISIGAVFYYTFIRKKARTEEETDPIEQPEGKSQLDNEASNLTKKQPSPVRADPIKEQTKRLLPKLGGKISEEQFNRIVMERYLLVRELQKKDKTK